MGLKHFIFDLDGTLIDSEEAILKTWQYTLKQYGYERSLEELRVVLGVTTEIGLQRLNAQVDQDYAVNWGENYGLFAGDANFFEGTKEMLEVLKEQGCSLGIVSSRNYQEYQDYFTKFDLDHLFTTKVLEEDTLLHKPNAEPLLKYMKLTGASKEECIYIGDMPSDINCANNAGVLSALVTWNRSGVQCDEAKVVFNSPSQVLEMVGE